MSILYSQFLQILTILLRGKLELEFSMKIRQTKTIQKPKVNFPVLLYFQQLFAANIHVKFLNPFSFWRKYKVEYLEKCWNFDMIRHFKNCHQLELTSKKFRNIKYVTKQNKFLISQPDLQLKYRGVVYQTNRIVAVDGNQVIFKSDSFAFGSSEQELLILELLNKSDKP